MSKGILEKLRLAVLSMDDSATVESAKEALYEKIDPLLALNEGLLKGMQEAGHLYEKGEYYIPELLMCSDAFYSGLEILKPYLEKKDNINKVKAVIGVVQGDIHDIGKNLVKLMLDISGFEVIDLGKNVAPSDFINTIEETGAQLLCLSTLMSSTLNIMIEIIDLLNKKKMRQEVKVLVGGAPVTKEFAISIGADGYAKDANKAVALAKALLA